MINLDKIAAQSAQKMVQQALAKGKVDSFERLVTKSLGVLQEQGVYALLVFLFSRTSDERDLAYKIAPELFRLLHELPQYQQSESLTTLCQNEALSDANVEQLNSRHKPTKEAAAQKIRLVAQQALQFYSDEVLDNLDNLLLIRDLYEQTLIYARYHAKAAGV